MILVAIVSHASKQSLSMQIIRRRRQNTSGFKQLVLWLQARTMLSEHSLCTDVNLRLGPAACFITSAEAKGGSRLCLSVSRFLLAGLFKKL